MSEGNRIRRERWTSCLSAFYGLVTWARIQEERTGLFPSRERAIMRLMRVIAKRTLRTFWEKCEDAKEPLEAWHHEVVKRAWKTPNEVKQQFRNASILKGGRAVFNIAGNKYRLVVAIDYVRQVVFVKFIGTHAQYDQINAETE